MKLYTQAEAAKKFSLSRRSLIRYEADGLIEPVRTPGGQPLIDPHIGFLAGARRPFTFGPVCDLCATTRQAGGW